MQQLDSQQQEYVKSIQVKLTFLNITIYIREDTKK